MYMYIVHVHTVEEKEKEVFAWQLKSFEEWPDFIQSLQGSDCG